MRVTCFLSSLDNIDVARVQVSTAFPTATANFVQLTRLGIQPLAACEGVGKVEARSTIPVSMGYPSPAVRAGLSRRRSTLRK